MGGFWPASHHTWALFDIHAKPQDLDVAYVSKVIENPCKSCIFMYTPIQSLIYAFLLQILAYSLILHTNIKKRYIFDTLHAHARLVNMSLKSKPRKPPHKPN